MLGFEPHNGHNLLVEEDFCSSETLTKLIVKLGFQELLVRMMMIDGLENFRIL
jgi:hypothetical protein